MTTWTISSSPSGNLPARGEARVAASGRSHQKSVAFVDGSLRVLRVDMRVTADHLVFGADAADSRHRFDDGGVIVLAWGAEILRQVTLADQHHADARHLLQDAGQVVDGEHVLAHDDDENLAIPGERPAVSLLVVLLRRDSPVARRVHRLIATYAFRVVGS